MIRFALILLVAVALLTAPLAAEAQPARPARVARLAAFPTPQIEAFREAMRELGYVEGQTYTIEERYTGGKPERYAELAADLARSRVDLILTNLAGARAVREVAPTIPVIFFSGVDPVAEGFVASYYQRSFAEAGGLMSYGPDLRYVWRRTAVYADRILRGTPPGDLPVEQPARYELVVNLRTARALGLTIPQSVLLRADEVIQ